MSQGNVHEMDEFFNEEDIKIALKEELQKPETQQMLEDIKNKDIKNAVDYKRKMQKLKENDVKLFNIKKKTNSKEDLETLETNTATKTLTPYEQKQQKISKQYDEEMRKINEYYNKLKKILEKNTVDIQKKIEADKKRKRDQREKAYSRIKQYRVATPVKTTANDLKNKKNNEEIIKQQQQKLKKIKKINKTGLSDKKEEVKHNTKLQLMFQKKPKNVSYTRPVKKLTTQDISI